MKLPTTAAEARRLADQARSRALARREAIRQQVIQQVASGHRRLGLTPVKVVVDRWCDQDPTWKGAVADNQWFLQQAAAYAAVEQLDLLARIADQNEKIIARFKEM